MPLPPFCVLRDGEPLSAIALRHTVKTGISANEVRLDLGMISEFEERQAAVFTGTPWTEWMAVDPRERAASVAHMRYHHLIGVHTNDAVNRDSERRRKRKKVE